MNKRRKEGDELMWTKREKTKKFEITKKREGGIQKDDRLSYKEGKQERERGNV